MINDISTIDHTLAPASLRRGHRLRTPTTALAVLMLGLAAVACSKGDSTHGQALPPAALTSLETGEAASWPEGKPMVVNFWASWCAPCRKEMPAFDAVADDLGDEVAIVGVTDERDLDEARRAAQRAAVSYPLVVDQDQTLSVDLGVTGLPGTVFVNEDGTVASRHLGAMSEQELRDEIEERYGIS